MKLKSKGVGPNNLHIVPQHIGYTSTGLINKTQYKDL